MVVHLIFSIILFTNTVLNYRAAGCSTQGHFTDAKLEISTGNLSCADSNWGWPEIIIWDGAIVSKFELTTNDSHKNKLEEYKNMLGCRDFRIDSTVLIKKEVIFNYYLIIATHSVPAASAAEQGKPDAFSG